MGKELSFAWYALRTNIRNSAGLRGSFLMSVVGMMLNNVAFIIIWVFFVERVGVIGGWTAADIIGLQGFMSLAYGVAYSASAGLAHLPNYVASGAFDRYLLSPKHVLLRVATSTFHSSAVGDLLFGSICLALYGYLAGVGLPGMVVLVAVALLAVTLFLSFAVGAFATSFFFHNPHAVPDILLEGFITPSLFHGGAFQGATRFVFTFIIPSLLIGTLPVEAVKHAGWENLGILVIFVPLWFLGAVLFFNRAVRHYESANTATFGE